MWALKPPSKQFNSCNLSSICNPYSGCQVACFFKQSHICVCTSPTDLVSVFRGGIDPFRLYFTARQESRRRRRRSSFRPKELFFSQAASSSGTVLDQLFPVRFFLAAAPATGVPKSHISAYSSDQNNRSAKIKK